MSRFVIALGSLAIATLASAPALADCIPGTGLCAQVSVGVQPFGGYAPPPQAVPQQAAPPAYPVQPEVMDDDEPQARPRYRYRRAARPRQPNWGASKLGLDIRLDGASGFGAGRNGNAYGMGGAGLGLRYRALPHLGFEAGVDLLGGRDFMDRKRFEVVGSAGGLVFFNPRSRAQVYLSGGMVLDYARATPDSRYLTAIAPMTNTYTHLGGYGGLGLEIFATRNLAFHFDAKGVVRQTIASNTQAPEFNDNRGRSTNTSGGFVGSAGLAVYF